MQAAVVFKHVGGATGAEVHLGGAAESLWEARGAGTGSV